MKTTYYTFLLATMIAIAGCKNEDPQFQSGDYNSLEEFLTERAPAVQTFTIAANATSTITGAKGTVLVFSPYSFVLPSGSYATGNIQIELKEIFSNADMIYSGVMPISNGNLLNSGGEYYVGASQDGVPLKLAPGAKYSATIPAQYSDPAMTFWSGNGSDSSVNWQQVNEGFDSLGVFNSLFYDNFSDTYSILTDSIGWCNCDVFSGLPVVNCDFKLTGFATLTNKNTIVYAILDEYNSVFTLTEMSEENTIHQTGIGVMGMHILAITVYNGYLYYSLEAITPEAGVTYELPLTATTDAEMAAIIDGLL